MPRQKPSIYLDTNILSALHYEGRSVQGAHRRIVSRDWWEAECKYFALFASRFTEIELERGKFRGQKQALGEVRRLPFLPHTKRVEETAQVYVEAGLVPHGKFSDALQLAYATVHVIDYLLTWNYAHLMNPGVQLRLSEINKRLGQWTPHIESPESMPKHSLGQRIRRRDRP